MIASEGRSDGGSALSTVPSQSLSMPSQASTEGCPGVQLSTRVPTTHDVAPVAAHAPMPQFVVVAVSAAFRGAVMVVVGGIVGEVAPTAVGRCYAASPDDHLVSGPYRRVTVATGWGVTE